VLLFLVKIEVLVEGEDGIDQAVIVAG